jgi:archaellum component FlaC
MQRAQMDRMAKDLNELQVLKDNAEKAVDQAERSKQSVEELKGLIADLESRIGGLPEQTVRRIVEILQASLQEAEKADREKE